MTVEQLSLDQKIAVALMNLPPAETLQVWSELSNSEKSYYSQLWEAMPTLPAGLCERVMDALLADVF
jgi:flagellar motor switch protein FliG